METYHMSRTLSLLKVTESTYERIRYGAYVIRRVPKNWEIAINSEFDVVSEKERRPLPVVVLYTCDLEGYTNAGIRRIR
jgi:hypothetical protein